MHTTHLGQHHCTTLCNLGLIKGGLRHHPNGPLMGYTPHVRLGCEFLEDGMNFVPNKFMQNHMFILELGHETAKTPWRRFIGMSRGSSEEALPSAHFDPYGFKMIIGVRYFLGDLQGVAF